jgi:hypothetical protein
MKVKYPLKMVVSDQSKGHIKATTSLESLNDSSKNIQQELNYLERDYSILVEVIREIMDISSQQKKVDPRLYWLIGDNIIRFLERINDLGFYLMQQNKTFARDVQISESSVEKIIAFRRRFEKLSIIDPEISWANYRENKVTIPDENSNS